MFGVMDMTLSMVKDLAIWGDSLLKGIVLDETEGKYRPLKASSVNLFRKVCPIHIKNNSHFGCTAPKALKNLESALNKGLTADAVLLEFGGNDCDFDWPEVTAHPEREHQPHTPLSQFKETMNRMIELLLQNGIRPLLMNLPPIDGERYYRWISGLKGVDGDILLKWLVTTDTIYRQQERYSNAIEHLSYEKRLPLIDVRDRFLGMRDYSDYLCRDGIHLNEKGQAVLGEVFSSYAVALG